MGSEEDQKLEEGSEQVIRNEGHGTGEADPKYVSKVLKRFSMADAKLVRSTLLTNCKLSGKQNPKTKVGKAEMMKVPYASAVESLMYAMVCTHTDIEYEV